MANKKTKAKKQVTRKRKYSVTKSEKSSQTPEAKPVTITAAKGRPMLTWGGKRPLRQVTAFPAQLIESLDPPSSFQILGVGIKSANWQDWPKQYPKGGLLFHGDNKEVLAHLLANGFRGKVKSIYIDPPFNTGVDYVRRVILRTSEWKGPKIEAEGYSFTEQVQYASNWSDDMFLQLLYDRLQLLKELLCEDGALFIRMDVHYGHYVKLICDEIFGRECFINEFVVNRIRKNVTKQGRLSIPNAVDSVYVFSKDPKYGYEEIIKPLSEKKEGYWRAMDSAEVRPNPERIIEGRSFFPPPGRHFTFTQERIDEMYAKGKIRINPNNGRPEYWVEEKDFITLDTDWTDIPGYTFTTGYPTENSELLLNRILRISTKENDIVLDSFIGSGTTAAVAQKLARRWIGCDINKGAIQTTSKRLQTIISNQIKDLEKKSSQGKLELGESDDRNLPAQFSFSIYRVNDYDLQIQHNEAVNLVCEHIGVTRTRSDAFFDGTQGKKLVKIIPFQHPLSPLDLEEINKELKARPSEDRDILVVCLGKELAADAWLEGWNRLRKKGDVPNKIEDIELRSDPKHGKFIKHEPAKARVKISRKGDKIHVAIEDFVSPTIIERLSQQNGVLQPKIEDWRSMVDCVMIDTAYNGEVFNVVLSDVPEKKNDFVIGAYELPAPVKSGKTKVAVKIIDMLGEEVVEVREV
jgi:DNA modification methylase